MDAAVLMLVLGYLIQAIFQIVIPGARQLPSQMQGGIPVGLHLFNLVLQFIVAAVLAMMVYSIGRLFGGTGTRLQSFVLVSWHTLVTSVLAPAFIWGMSHVSETQVPPAPLFVLAVSGSTWLWVLAAFTAELHGFRSTWGPLGIMLVASFLFSFLIMTLIPAS